MNRDQKAAVVEELVEQIDNSAAIFAVDYRGITVAQAAELREKLRAVDARFRVVKNSLSELAADRAGAEHLKPLLSGPVALTFVKGDPAAAAKSLNDTARATNLLEFRGGVLGETALSAEDVRSIARLPSRDVLNAQLVGTIAAPLSGLVRTLNALIAGVAIQLKAIADQGLVGGGVPAPATAEADPPDGGESDPAAGDEPAPPAAGDESASPAADDQPAPADVQEAAEQPSDDPDSEPHDAPVQPSQAEGEDTTPQED